MTELAGGRRYEIVVRGRLSLRFATAFDGVALQPCGADTRLSADLADQAQLYGLLNRLRDFGIELVSINARTGETDAC